jgi:hypothetical protein
VWLHRPEQYRVPHHQAVSLPRSCPCASVYPCKLPTPFLNKWIPKVMLFSINSVKYKKVWLKITLEIHWKDLTMLHESMTCTWWCLFEENRNSEAASWWMGASLLLLQENVPIGCGWSYTRGAEEPDALDLLVWTLLNHRLATSHCIYSATRGKRPLHLITNTIRST